MRMPYVGCAGWRLPKSLQPEFPGSGTHLARYGRRLPATEINRSFYGPIRHELYAKWASEVPSGFRFAVKMPRSLTHHQRLRAAEGLAEFLEATEGLGEKRGPLLLQLPPSLAFESDAVQRFLEVLREAFSGSVVCEPRHSSWFTSEVDALLRRFAVARVAVDPPPVEGAAEPGGCPDTVYVRLHGSPQRFYSAYSADFLRRLGGDLRKHAAGADTWCIFNNTATDSGLHNALDLQRMITGASGHQDASGR